MNQRNIVNRLLVIVLLAVVTSFFPVYAQQMNPLLYSTETNGQQSVDTIDAAEPFVAAAPMKLVCESRIEAPEGYTWRCEWNRSLSPGFETNELTRFEDDTEFFFYDSGTYYIRLLVTFTDADGNSSPEPEVSATYTIKISESELKVPNAFSPNGDGINDIFKVHYKSLIKFNAYIFNRWGQQLYHWGLSEIDGGWDGSYKGKQVKDGVYFVVIEAEGSDGIKYKHKGDITILRGFSGTGSNDSTTGGE